MYLKISCPPKMHNGGHKHSGGREVDVDTIFYIRNAEKH